MNNSAGKTQSAPLELSFGIGFNLREELTLWLRTRLCPQQQESALSRESRSLVEASQTLGAAFLAGLQPHARCLRGRRMGPVKVEPCGYDAMLDLESLIWTRGAKFPCWRLSQRMRCPRCGGMAVELVWLPGPSPAVRAGRDLYQCAVAAGKG